MKTIRDTMGRENWIVSMEENILDSSCYVYDDNENIEIPMIPIEDLQKILSKSLNKEVKLVLGLKDKIIMEEDDLEKF